jgi:RNA polymerase sigma factor (sigma-70 family)
VRKRRIQWALTQTAFDRLLESLGDDRSRAGDAYQQLRAALVKFFESRGAASAEDAADEVFNRIARRLEAGEQIVDMRSYAYGVARRVLLEAARDRPANLVDVEASPAEIPAPAGENNQSLDCLEECVESLPADDRQLILDYHREQGAARITRRQALAERLRIPLNALRIRAHRIRGRLEECVTACVTRKRPW